MVEFPAPGPVPDVRTPHRDVVRNPGVTLRVWVVVRYPLLVGREADHRSVRGTKAPRQSPLCTSRLKLVPLDKTNPIGVVLTGKE